MGGAVEAAQAIRILLVEDNPDDALIFKRLLKGKESAPHEIEHATRLSEARDLLARQSFDVVVMDPGLPDSQGLDTFLAISVAAPHVPVIVLTGLDDERFGLAAVQRGAQDYLVKGTLDRASIARVLRYSIERHRMQTMLRAAKEEAESADRLKSAFLATISHELRTPLNHIIGFTGILMQGLPGPVNEEQLKQLGFVRESSRHLLNIVLDILEISQLTAGRAVVSVDGIDLKTIAASASDSMRGAAEARGLAMEFRCALDGVAMRGDEKRIQQVLKRLLDNAIKFTERGRVVLTLDRMDGRAILEVRDTGIGIRPEEISSLFQPFRQVDDRLCRKHPGVGLSLALCRRQVELMGGTIEVRSREGEGSTFTVSLPLESAQPAASEKGGGV